MIINGLRIPHPATFKRREVERPRISAAPPMFQVKRTETARPPNPRAIHAMPVIAIVAAIGSIAAGAAGAAALVAGTVTLTTVLAGAMVVGGAMTLIGAATGNQNLMKYGGILSAVGGIGTLGLNLMGGAEAAAATTGLDATGGPGDALDLAGTPTAVGGPGEALTGPTSTNTPIATAPQPGVLGSPTDAVAQPQTVASGATPAAPTGTGIQDVLARRG